MACSVDVQPRILPGLSYGWDGSAWVEGVAPPPQPGTHGADTVRLATFNILADCFPWVVELATQSQARYAALVPTIEAVLPDVLGLNEVTPTALTALLESPVIRSQYTVSHVPETLLPPHACVILARSPVVSSHTIHLITSGIPSTPARSQFPVAIVETRVDDSSTTNSARDDDTPNSKLVVGCLHTRAYQTAENREFRKSQIREFTAGLRLLAKETGVPECNVVVMGDLNLHDKNEDATVFENGLLDTWAETHFQPSGDGSEGMTFDAARNPMIKRYIPGECRQMRLDRILVGSGCAVSFASQCVMWGTEPLKSLRDVTLSDHYALYIDVAYSPDTALAGVDEVRKKLEDNAALPPEPRKFTYIGFAFNLIGHSGFLLARALGLV
ncbi:hypothetical protein DIPPA_26077 [Diplonema papillatum]|nr:hypothetical protein DIPPA_26077 [Diplonema papillatum]|eukprot:gene10072-15483_t